MRVATKIRRTTCHHLVRTAAQLAQDAAWVCASAASAHAQSGVLDGLVRLLKLCKWHEQALFTHDLQDRSESLLFLEKVKCWLVAPCGLAEAKKIRASAAFREYELCTSGEAAASFRTH